LKFEPLEHHSYSLDFERSDFHMSGPLKFAITWAHVSNDEEVTKAVHSWLAGNTEPFFISGITNLLERWAKCMEKW